MEALIILVVGAVGVPLINVLKNWLKLSGKPAQVLAGVVSVLIAVGVMFYNGDVVLADFNWVNFFALGGQIFTVSTLTYKLLLKG